MVTNRRLVKTEGADFYPTPRWGTKALLKYESFEGGILEPCCGDGAMSKVLIEAGYDVYSTNKFDQGYGTHRDLDFLDRSDSRNRYRYSNIVTNPPFNIAEEIFKEAYFRSTGKVCLLLRTAFLESVRRYNTIFSMTPPNRVYVFSQRLSMYPAGQEVKGGGTTSYSWFVWDKNETSIGTQIKWIEPGLKERELE